MLDGDDWYVAGVEANDAQAMSDAKARQTQGVDALQKAGQAQVGDRYNVAGMVANGVPMDGTTEPRYRVDNERFAGHFDVSTGRSWANPPSPRPPLKWSAGLAEAFNEAYGLAEKGPLTEESIRTIGTAVYEFGADIWDFGVDVAEWLTPYELPEAPEAPIAPRGTPGQVMVEVAPFLTGFAAAKQGLRKLLGAGRSAFARAAQSASAGGMADFVIADPREDSLLDLMDNFYGLQGTVVDHLNPAAIYETLGPMAARLGMAAEGLVVGSVIEGLFAAGKRGAAAAAALSLQADEAEQIAVQALSHSQATPAGLSQPDSGWLTTWMGARILKGEKRLSDEMRTDAAQWGATADQTEAAWNRAATLAQEAHRRQVARQLPGEPNGG